MIYTYNVLKIQSEIASSQGTQIFSCTLKEEASMTLHNLHPILLYILSIIISLDNLISLSIIKIGKTYTNCIKNREKDGF